MGSLRPKARPRTIAGLLSPWLQAWGSQDYGYTAINAAFVLDRLANLDLAEKEQTGLVPDSWLRIDDKRLNGFVKKLLTRFLHWSISQRRNGWRMSGGSLQLWPKHI